MVASSADLQVRLQGIENRISALQGGAPAPTVVQVDKPKVDKPKSVSAPAAASIAAPLIDRMDKEFAKVADALIEQYGTKLDDKTDGNEVLDALFEEVGDMNYYTCLVLLMLDPVRDFDTYRNQAKVVLLPFFQILVPFGMSWYFLVVKGMMNDNICCDHENVIFRFTGFVAFMYSGWQILDGANDASSSTLLRYAVQHWSMTGWAVSKKATLLFYLANLSQQVCALLLLILTYVLFTFTCDTPLDLLMNCVAVNFVLDVDSEWMDDSSQELGKASATDMLKRWRDCCVDEKAEIKGSMRNRRPNAPTFVNLAIDITNTALTVIAYFLAVGWTLCPASW